MRLLIAMGSNVGDRDANLRSACEAIEVDVGSINSRSQWYETEPVLHPEHPTPGQGKFLNGVITVDTELTPKEVLRSLLSIELSLGRERNQTSGMWGPRTIDLDILGAEQQIINTALLTIPHPRLHEREFVLEPLMEIAPDWQHPVLGKTVKELWDELQQKAEARGRSRRKPARA